MCGETTSGPKAIYLTPCPGAAASSIATSGSAFPTLSQTRFVLWRGFRSALVSENLQKMGSTNVDAMTLMERRLDAGLPTAKTSEIFSDARHDSGTSSTMHRAVPLWALVYIPLVAFGSAFVTAEGVGGGGGG